MELEASIARVRELLAERDEIDRELSDLLTTGPRPLTVRNKKDAVSLGTTKRRKKSACSVCGKPGHNVMTCPQGKGTHPNNPHDEEPDEHAGALLSENQYSEVRTAKENGASSWDAAAATGLPRKQVNIAFQASTYARYKMIAERE